MAQIPYMVGRGKQRRIGGYWECSPEDEAWARFRRWSLHDGCPTETDGGRQRASRQIAERMLERPLQANEEVHHRDENPLNNHRENLQVLTKSEHSRHVHASRDNGLPPGVSRHRERFVAQICRGGVRRRLGSFDTFEEASAAYQKALKEEGE